MEKKTDELGTDQVKVGLTGRRFTVRSVNKSEDKLYGGENGEATKIESEDMIQAAERKLISDGTNGNLHQANGENKPMFQIGTDDVRVDHPGKAGSPLGERLSTGFPAESKKSTSDVSSDGDEVKPLAPFGKYGRSDDIFIPIAVAEKKYGDGRFGKFSDSFKDQCLIQQRKSPALRREFSNDFDEEEDLTIVVPVPSAQELKQRRQTVDTVSGTHLELDESHYETQKSLTKLFQENHKSAASLASVGRFFGSRQRIIEASETHSMQLMPPPKKKITCECESKATIVGLIFTALIIITFTVLVHNLFGVYQDQMAEDIGYTFSYKTRELNLYAHADADNVLAPKGGIKFTAHLGRNLGYRLPYNCTHELADLRQSNVTAPHLHQPPLEQECYRWNSGPTLNLKLTPMDGLDNSFESMCLHVKWTSKNFNPILEDCIEMDDSHGKWYGGMINTGSAGLQSLNFSSSYYQPGNSFGSLTERFWFTTHGISVTAPYDFPLYLKISNEDVGHEPSKTVKYMCFSSWYGYKEGTRKLEYSICRSSNFSHAYLSTMRSRPRQSSKNFTKLIGNLPIELESLINNSTSITPYIDAIGEQFTNNVGSTAWMKNPTLDAPKLFSKYGKIVAMLNTTDSEALQIIRDKSDRGHFSFLDDVFPADITGIVEYPLSELTSTFQHYLNNFIEAAITENQTLFAATVAGSSETGAIFVLPQVSTLTELIQAIIQASLTGYRLISSPRYSGLLTDKEFIRYFQIVSFLPSIFINSSSIPLSGQYKNAYETTLRFRNQTVLKRLSTAMKDDYLQPLYKPLWWCFPNLDQNNFLDQFIFHDYMVAPMVDNAVSRKVYFPPGLWRRLNETDAFIYGPSYKTLEVKISELLIFKKIELNDPNHCFS